MERRALLTMVTVAVLAGLFYHVLTSGPDLLGSPRSGAWPRVRAEHLERVPACEACGTRKALQVHHVKPFHEYPELELEPSNLMTLCPWCHLHHGHDRDGFWGKQYEPNWSTVNPNVRRDVEAWRRGKR